MTNFDEIYDHCKELFNECREQKTVADIMIIEKNSGWAIMKDGTKVDVNLAIEKQIPKKPILIEEHDQRWIEVGFNCPYCKCTMFADDGDYCSSCGQRIDWSDDDDNDSNY